MYFGIDRKCVATYSLPKHGIFALASNAAYRQDTHQGHVLFCVGTHCTTLRYSHATSRQ